MQFFVGLLWRLPVLWRRVIVFGGTLGLLLVTVIKLSGGLFRGPADLLTAATSSLFIVLACFAALAWTLRIAGFVVSMGSSFRVELPESPPSTRTAIIMPVYHEDVERVCLGIRQTWRSARAHGLSGICDFFVLSDSKDPDVMAAEESGLLGLLPEFDMNKAGSGRIFLVRREERSGYKAGNIANFLHRHGADYEFMLVLDADSVMTGDRIRRLIQKLEGRPSTALIQSLMTIFRARTLFARIMQSSQNPQSALYSSGLRWLLGSEGIYWGHNALIRIRPFAAHAMLPSYPWPAPEGGRVLSQDVHEASLLGRAGWAVDLDLDEGGSFEEMPANVLSNAERDRRWCQGDFLNLALVLCPEIKPGQRMWLFYIFTGYFMSLPVLGIMLLGSVDACRMATLGGSGAGWLVLLNIYCLQLVPKTLAYARSQFRHGAGRYGFVSFLLDTLGSILFGPLMLYLHARIVFGLLRGDARPWKSPSRDPDDAIGWKQAFDGFWPATLIGIVWLVGLFWRAPDYLAFCGPVMGIWALSIPVAVFSSRVGLSDAFARRGWMRASLSREEDLALGSLVLPPDRASDLLMEPSGLPGTAVRDPAILVPSPAAIPLSLGVTRLTVPWVGTASVVPQEVKAGLLSAPRVFGIGFLFAVSVLMLLRSWIGL